MQSRLKNVGKVIIAQRRKGATGQADAYTELEFTVTAEHRNSFMWMKVEMSCQKHWINIKPMRKCMEKIRHSKFIQM